MAWTAMLNPSAATRRPAPHLAALGGPPPVALEPGRRPVLRTTPRPETFADLAADVAMRQHARSRRIGQELILGARSGEGAGAAYADLAEDCLCILAAALTLDMDAILDGAAFAVVGLGPLGSREMTAASPLDLALVHDIDDPRTLETLRDAWLGRLAAALSFAADGRPLYTLNLRPDILRLPDLERRLAAPRASTRLGLTRARVVWSSAFAFKTRIAACLGEALRRPRHGGAERQALAALLRRTRPSDPWDCRREPGGLDDIGAATRMAQAARACRGGPLGGRTSEALMALCDHGWLSQAACGTILEAWTLGQHVDQLLKAALPAGADPETQPQPIQALLACAAGSPDLAHLLDRVTRARAGAVASLRDLAREI